MTSMEQAFRKAFDKNPAEIVKQIRDDRRVYEGVSGTTNTRPHLENKGNAGLINAKVRVIKKVK